MEALLSSGPGLPIARELSGPGLGALWSSDPCLATPFWSEGPGFPGDLLASLPVLLLVLGWLVDGLPPLSSVAAGFNLFSGLPPARSSGWENLFVTDILLSDTVTSRGDATLCPSLLLLLLCLSSCCLFSIPAWSRCLGAPPGGE